MKPAVPAVVMSLAALMAACFSERSTAPQPSGVTCERAGQPPGLDTVFVVINGFAFGPAEVRVASGVRVVWINCEPEGTPGHTTTEAGGAWDSPTLMPGDVFSVVPSVGTHDYHCRPHPFIQGRVIVEAAMSPGVAKAAPRRLPVSMRGGAEVTAKDVGEVALVEETRLLGDRGQWLPRRGHEADRQIEPDPALHFPEAAAVRPAERPRESGRMDSDLVRDVGQGEPVRGGIPEHRAGAGHPGLNGSARRLSRPRHERQKLEEQALDGQRGGVVLRAELRMQPAQQERFGPPVRLVGSGQHLLKWLEGGPCRGVELHHQSVDVPEVEAVPVPLAGGRDLEGGGTAVDDLAAGVFGERSVQHETECRAVVVVPRQGAAPRVHALGQGHAAKRQTADDA